MWLLVALLLLGGLPAQAEPPGDDDPQAAHDALDVAITHMTPAVLRPGDDWTIKATVTNNGEEKLTTPVLRLRLQNYVPNSRSALAAWNISGASYSPIVLRAHRLEKDLAPGQTKKVSFTIPAEDSPFSRYSQWGPRGIAITATSGQIRAAQRTTVLWYPDHDPIDTTTELTVLAPLTPTSQEWSHAVDSGTSVAQAAAPRLAPVVRATAHAPVSWALDPALLDDGPLGEAAISTLTDTAAGPTEEPTQPEEPATPAEKDTSPSSTPQATEDRTPAQTENQQPSDQAHESDQPDGATDEAHDTSGTELADMIARDASARDVVAFGYADADPAALRLDRDQVLYDAAAAQASQLFASHEIQPIEDMLWPARHDLQSLATLADHGVRSVILPGDTQDPVTPLTYSPSGRSRITTEAGELEAALWDTRISAIFDSTRTPVQMRQALLAETAVIAREHPADGRGFLAALPRDIGSDPDHLQAIMDTLAAVEEAPWLELTNMRSLLGRSDPGIEREPLPPEPLSQPVLTPAQVADLSGAWSSLTALAQITPADEKVFGSLGSNILSAFSTTLVASPQTRDDLLTSSLQAAQHLSSAIQIEAGSTVNLISSSGEIPIAVQSRLHVPVTVTVRLVPEDPRLQADEVATLRLDPQSAATARIPVAAVSNGNVDVHAEVLTEPQGTVLATGEEFSVRVRADWESTGTIIVAAVLIVGFVIGLVRTIRRGRRSHARRNRAAGPSTPASTSPPSPGTEEES